MPYRTKAGNDNGSVFALTFCALDLWSRLSGFLVYLRKLFGLGTFVHVLLNATPQLTCYRLRKQLLCLHQSIIWWLTEESYCFSVTPSLPIINPSVCVLTPPLPCHLVVESLIISQKQKWQLYSRSATLKREMCIRTNKYGRNNAHYALSLVKTVAAKYSNYSKRTVMVMP